MVFQGYAVSARVSASPHPTCSKMDPTFQVNLSTHGKSFPHVLVSCWLLWLSVATSMPLLAILSFSPIRKKPKPKNSPGTVHGLTLIAKAKAHINSGFIEDFSQFHRSCLPSSSFCSCLNNQKVRNSLSYYLPEPFRLQARL